MTGHPLAASTRARLRADHRRRILAQAEQEARLHGLSAKCRGYDNELAVPRHSSHEDGCRNDGTTCLCACHDQPIKETP
ncbi:hypothetical protein ABT336_13165 [Micromonospora sp. NPDC000207]|uniref:hypothetical protein n=1 Tax=Micromonospora sp. NPDC000207 TaxID=3154246 RepID=UPI0033170A5F